MALTLGGVYPPSEAGFQLLMMVWYCYGVVAQLQWVTSWYGMGKTSNWASRVNIPGRVAWMSMELIGPGTLLYAMGTLPARRGIDDLPWQNTVLAGLYVLHYAYRALLFPLLQPSMAPIHVLVWLGAVLFQALNGTLLGAWLAAYGPATPAAWAAQLRPLGLAQFTTGIGLFYVGLASNYYHDEELREIRRREARRQERVLRDQGRAAGGGGSSSTRGVSKHYQIPSAGLFKYLLFPHYLSEWVEWLGFYVACGWGSVPARMCFINMVAVMLPRAVNGKRWYRERFGAEKIDRKWAVLPGVV